MCILVLDMSLLLFLHKYKFVLSYKFHYTCLNPFLKKLGKDNLPFRLSTEVEKICNCAKYEECNRKCKTTYCKHAHYSQSRLGIIENWCQITKRCTNPCTYTLEYFKHFCQYIHPLSPFLVYIIYPF